MKIRILKTVLYFMIGVMIGTFLVTRKPVEVVSPVADVTPTPTPVLGWNDEIRALFPKDVAGMMVRICLEEHKGQNGKYALRLEDNGTYSYGWCQINSIHRPARMNDFEWQSYLEDPKNHALETYRIYSEQGFNAWINSYNKVK